MKQRRPERLRYLLAHTAGSIVIEEPGFELRGLVQGLSLFTVGLGFKAVFNPICLNGTGRGVRIGRAEGSWAQSASQPAPSRLLTIAESRLLGTLLSLSLEPARAPCGVGFSAGSCAQHLQVHSWAPLTFVWGLPSRLGTGRTGAGSHRLTGRVGRMA